MNITDKLKQSQGQRDVSKFTPTRLELKNVEGKPNFKLWDGEKEILSDKPMKGIVLGQANQLDGFDNNLGPHGGTWTSSYYTTNNQVINLYAPGNSKPVHKGTKDELQAKVGSGVQLKSRKILFVVTQEGLYSIKTNMTIAIGQLNRLGDLSSNFVSLTPKLYDPADQTIPADTHKFLGAMAKKNPPTFASLEKEGPIEGVESWQVGDMDLEEIIDEFNKFKDRISGDSNESGEPSQDIQRAIDKNVDDINAEFASAVEDDSGLPF